jgi:hypothetical protein
MMSTLTPTTMPIIRAVWTEVLFCELLPCPNCVNASLEVSPDGAESGAGAELKFGVLVAVEGFEAVIKLSDERVAKSSFSHEYF